MELEIGGRRHVIDVRRDGGKVVVAVDGVEMAVDAVRSGGSWSLLLGNAPQTDDAAATDGGAGGWQGVQARRSYDVSVERRSPDELAVLVNGVAVRVDVASRRGRARGDDGSGPSAQTVLAPMPGRVVKVLVKVGDVVQAGQPVVVVEAMKMENELRVARAGTVSDVRATEGMLVEAGTVLLIVDSGEEVLPQES